MYLAHQCPKCGGYETVHVPPMSLEESVYDGILLLRHYGCMRCNWPFREFAFQVHLRTTPRPPRHVPHRPR